jgi:hypothetical protein
MFRKLVEEIRLEAQSKAQQYQGLYAGHPDAGIRKFATKATGSSIAQKVKDPKNKLAPQLVRAFRQDRKMGKAVRK